MRTLLIMLALLSIVTAKSLGRRKAAKLRKLAYETKYGILDLNREEYKYFVEDAQRPYNVVLFFTNHCPFCIDVEDEFNKLAKSYREQGGMLPEPHNKKHATFFVKITWEAKQQKTFSKFKLIDKTGTRLQVPDIVITTSKMFLLSPNEFDQLSKRNQWHITPSHSHGAFTIDKLRTYVNERTKWEILVHPPIKDLIQQIGILAICGVICYFMFGLVRESLLNPQVWFWGSIVKFYLICFICQAGLVFIIQRQPEFFGTNEDGSVKYLADGSRNMYAGEGYIFSFLLTISGLIFVAIFKLAKTKFNTYTLLILFLLVAGVYALSNLKTFVSNKVSTAVSFYPPQWFTQGHWTVDQGNNI